MKCKYIGLLNYHTCMIPNCIYTVKPILNNNEITFEVSIPKHIYNECKLHTKNTIVDTFGSNKLRFLSLKQFEIIETA